MTAAVAYKLLALMGVIGLGWLLMHRGWLAPKGSASPQGQPLLVLGNTLLYLFIPALLFRTMVRQDLDAMPLRLLAAYFVPAWLVTVAVYAVWRRRARLQGHPPGAQAGTRTVAAIYGNGVQVGLPVVTALFGEAGLALHIALVSLHGLVLLTTLTALVESDLARGQAGLPRGQALRSTLRNAVVHPVVLPVLLGLGWNLGGLGLHPAIDALLQTLGMAVVPLSLVLIGATLAEPGANASLADAWGGLVVKLVLMPAAVLLVAHQGFGVRGMPLQVLVLMAALPTGANALIFAQRYRVLQGQTSLAIVASTLCFAGTLALWLAVLAWVA